MKHFPYGKGLYVWNIIDMPTDWVYQFVEVMKLTWIAVKIADGVNSSNLRWLANGDSVDDILGPFVDKAKAAGLQVYGWQYIYGYNPKDEAEKAAKRMRKFDLAGFIIDAEAYYKNRPVQASIYSSTLRDLLVDKSISLSTYRFPELHRDFPFAEFLTICDYNSPQVYWNPGKAGIELKESVKQYNKLTDLPMIPAGRAYAGNGFPKPTPAEIDDFLDTAGLLGQTGAFFWSADALYHRLRPLPEIVDAIAAYEWDDPTLPPTKCTEKIRIRLTGEDDRGNIWTADDVWLEKE